MPNVDQRGDDLYWEDLYVKQARWDRLAAEQAERIRVSQAQERQVRARESARELRQREIEAQQAAHERRAREVEGLMAHRRWKRIMSAYGRDTSGWNWMVPMTARSRQSRRLAGRLARRRRQGWS